MTGDVTGTEAVVVSYVADAIPEDTLSTDADGDDETEDYVWLSMSYILVNDQTADGAQKTTLESLAYTFTTEDSEQITFSDGLTSVPVQRNYRSNIVGQILTGNIDFNIVIEPAYTDDYTYPDTAEEQLKMAAAYGGTVTLDEDVALDETLTIAEGVSTTINLNGNSITLSETSTSQYTILTSDDSVLTINDDSDGTGSVGDGESDYSVIAMYGGELVINGGTYKGSISSSSSQITITDGTFDSYFVFFDSDVVISGGTFSSGLYLSDNSITITGGTFSGTSWLFTGTMTISGGTFNDAPLNLGATLSITGGTFYYEPTSGIASGYHAVQTCAEPLTYMVVEESVTDVATDSDALASVLASLADSGEEANILLMEDETYVISDGISADNVTIDGNGATIDATDGTLVISGDNVTISSVTLKGDDTETAGGTINITGSNTTITDVTFEDGRTATYGADITISVSDANSVITVQDCDFSQSGAKRGLLIYALSGTLVIDNCSFDNTYPFNVNLTYDTGSIQVTNSTLNGWTSYAYLEGGVSFTNCSFGRSTSGYAFCRPYSNTTFTSCNFISEYRVGCGHDDISVSFSGCTWETGADLTVDIIDTSEFENHSGSTYTIE